MQQCNGVCNGVPNCVGAPSHRNLADSGEGVSLNELRLVVSGLIDNGLEA